MIDESCAVKIAEAIAKAAIKYRADGSVASYNHAIAVKIIMKEMNNPQTPENRKERLNRALENVEPKW